MPRRERILALMEDVGGCDLLYYNRKEDEDLPRGEIEAAIAASEITVDEIVEAFKAALIEGLK